MRWIAVFKLPENSYEEIYAEVVFYETTGLQPGNLLKRTMPHAYPMKYWKDFSRRWKSFT